MKVIKDPGINNSTYLFESPHQFNNFNKYLFNDELPKQTWTGDYKDRALSLHHDRDRDLINKIDNLIKFKQDSSASPRQSGELDHNDMIMLHYLNSSDVANAISYALMLKGLGMSEDERHKLALDIATSNKDFDLTPEGIRKVVDDATKDLPEDDNIDYDNVADMQLDEYIAEHELQYPDESENINTDHLEWPKDPHDSSFYLSEEEEDELEKLFEEHPEISHSVMEEDDDSNPDEGDMNSNGAYYLNSDWVSPRAFFNHMKSLKPKTENTDVSGLAKSITQQDLGRTFDKEEK